MSEAPELDEGPETGSESLDDVGLEVYVEAEDESLGEGAPEVAEKAGGGVIGFKAHGNAVAVIKALLIGHKLLDAGRSGTHSTFDGVTERAVKAFQRTNSLRVTGVVDARTATMLAAKQATPSIHPGDKVPEVEFISRILVAAGLLLEPTDEYNDEVSDALDEFLGGRGQKVIGAGTWEKVFDQMFEGL